MSQYSCNKLFSNISAGGVGVWMWYCPVGRGNVTLEKGWKRICATSLFFTQFVSLIMVGVFGGWWPSQWTPCWCSDGSAYSPCIIMETAEWSDTPKALIIEEKHKLCICSCQTFCVSHLALSLDITWLHSPTPTPAVRHIYWFPVCICIFTLKVVTVVFTWTLELFKYYMMKLQKLEFHIRHRL